MNNFKDKCDEVAEMLERKNDAYGDFFQDTEGHLKLLFPNGIAEKDYGTAVMVIRVLDVIKKICNNEDYRENGYKYLAGYGILGMIQSEFGYVLDELTKQALARLEETE